MGKKGGKKGKDSKGKKEVKNKKPSEKWKKYGDKKGKTCPKCGPGIFLGEHKDRLACGKCGYTEFIKK